MKFYTHLSDQFAPFHTEVIVATANEAPHVLDGLLYHQSSLVINEHYTDTGVFSDHVFAMCRLLGFLFAPTIRDLEDKRLYILPGMQVPPEMCSPSTPPFMASTSQAAPAFPAGYRAVCPRDHG